MSGQQLAGGGHVLYEILRLLMKDPCLILMIGNWRQGKTDTSLLIGYLAKKWGLIDAIGSNIYTYDNPLVEYVISMGRLRRWLFHDRLTKLFVFDEALSRFHKRRAMSKETTTIIPLIAELSKAHGRIIFCSQTTDVESTFQDEAFLRAVFFKINKTTMTVRSSLFKPLTITDIPKSPIQFDKDRIAEFSLKESIEYDSLSLEMRCALGYARGMSIRDLGKQLSEELHTTVYDEQVRRGIRKVLKSILEKESLEIR
jgi:hypothetical protein